MVYEDDDIENELIEQFQIQNNLSKVSVHSLHTKPEFKPRYLNNDENNDNDKERLNALNAIIEITALWEYVEKEALYNYSFIYSKLSIPLSDSFKQTCKKHKEAFAVYDRQTKAWLMKPSDPTYNYCYNGESFVDFIEAKFKKTGNRLLLVGKYTTIMQEPNLLTATEAATSYFPGFVLPNINLTVGVPGCGKTNNIINNHNRRSLVLTSCKEGALDIRTRMAKKEGGEPSDYSWSYRTIDSYLMNSRDMYSYVWVDEALMEHPGKLFLVCLFSCCRYLNLLGDPNQLGYINRTDAVLLYDKSSIFFKPTRTDCLNTSFRCPVDVMAILSKNFHYDGASSASNILRSLKSKTFTSLKDVPKLEGTKYLVFKQAEKKQMKEVGYDVSTVHEYQGKEAARVVLVRMSRNYWESLYESVPHMLVAMSRHTEMFVYYTPVTDKLKQILDQQFTDDELRKHQVKPAANCVGILDCKTLEQADNSLPSTVNTNPTQFYTISLTDADNDPQLTLLLTFKESYDPPVVNNLPSKCFTDCLPNTNSHAGDSYYPAQAVPFQHEEHQNIPDEIGDSFVFDEHTIPRPIVKISFMFIFYYTLDRVIAEICTIIIAFIFSFILIRIFSAF